MVRGLSSIYKTPLSQHPVNRMVQLESFATHKPNEAWRRVVRYGDGQRKIRAGGVGRGALDDEAIEDPDAAEAFVRTVHATFESYAKLNKKVPPEVVNSIEAIGEPSKLSDTVVAHLNLKLEERQELRSAAQSR